MNSVERRWVLSYSCRKVVKRILDHKFACRGNWRAWGNLGCVLHAQSFAPVAFHPYFCVLELFVKGGI